MESARAFCAVYVPESCTDKRLQRIRIRSGNLFLGWGAGVLGGVGVN